MGGYLLQREAQNLDIIVRTGNPLTTYHYIKNIPKYIYSLYYYFKLSCRDL